MVFQEFIAEGNLTIFVDNDGARHQLINGYAADKDTAHLLDINAQTDAQMGCLCWVTRVPTSANPADAPSRLKFDRLSELGTVNILDAETVKPSWQKVMDHVLIGRSAIHD